jgi:hypothetical protein
MILSVVIAGSLATVGGIWLFRNAQAFKKSPWAYFGVESTQANWKAPALDSKQFDMVKSTDWTKNFNSIQDQLKRMNNGNTQFTYQPPKFNIPTYQPPRINIPTYQPPRSPVFRH